ncbi:MAG: alpha/beta fold hydrolase [Phycisphaerae bacterium]|nr:alpha/beta fold hydrolase [Phycisphaerae bacterium]
MTGPPDRFRQFPAALARRARLVRLGGEIPALLAHPDWITPAPVVIWLHGRTVSKELDPGRYLRWIRAGIAACAIDLPGHGERFDESLHRPGSAPALIERALPEIDRVLAALAEGSAALDLSRVAIGGMSAGGMIALRRLCDPHPFACAAVEAATGRLTRMYAARQSPTPPETLARVDPSLHLDSWRPIPLLALHSEADRVVPVETMREFAGMLRERHAALGADPAMVEMRTWPETGAPEEHAGFGRFSNDAKNAQTEFLRRHLGPTPPDSL